MCIAYSIGECLLLPLWRPSLLAGEFLSPAVGGTLNGENSIIIKSLADFPSLSVPNGGHVLPKVDEVKDRQGDRSDPSAIFCFHFRKDSAVLASLGVIVCRGSSEFAPAVIARKKRSGITGYPYPYREERRGLTRGDPGKAEGAQAAWKGANRREGFSGPCLEMESSWFFCRIVNGLGCQCRGHLRLFLDQQR